MTASLRQTRHRTHSPAETSALGRQIAAGLEPGDVVGLVGDLGAGKTCLIQGICEGLGVADPVTSPTFILIGEYEGRRGARAIPVYHFDLYRLNDPSELRELGCEEYFYGDGICLVEWAERARGLMPEGTVWVEIAWAGDEDREITIRG